MKYDLSILIPARNEQFLARTVQDLLEHKKGATEILIGLDGAWADPGIPDHPDVKILYYPESIGQRAITNQLCKLSKAKYVMKVDAHTAWDDGFDVKLLADMQDDWTMVPVMRNLHAFDWVCPDGHRRYQGPSGPCTDCGKETTKDVVWIAKHNPQSTAYRVDTTLHFQYMNEQKSREDYRRGVCVGYILSFDVGLISPSIVQTLTDFADSHHFTGSIDSLSNWQGMPIDTMGLSLIHSSRTIRASEIDGVGDKLQMGGITTSSISTEMVNNRDITTTTPRYAGDKPGVSEPVHHLVSTLVSDISVTSSIQSLVPIPTTANSINVNTLKELSDIIGSEFTYNEKADSFHNGSITLLPVYNKSLNETMSLQGSCFLLTREKYWELNICDESHGSWGQQGVEVAFKTWLSGGRVVCNKKTWYAHMFRTQGGDFGFPYPLSGHDVEKARKYSKDLFLNGGFKGTRDLQWLLDKFAPLPGWHDNKQEAKQTDAEPESNKAMIYYTDNQLTLKIAKTVQKQLKHIAQDNGMMIYTSSLKPMTFGDKNVVINEPRGYRAYFKQIIAALEMCTKEIVFFTEHDVLYHPSHFDFIPPEKDKFYYNLNVWRLKYPSDYAVTWEANQVAELCCYRELALEWYNKKYKEFEAGKFDRSFEPGGRDNLKFGTWMSAEPNIDIRHGANLTKSKWSIHDFRDKTTCIGWQVGKCPEWAKELLPVENTEM